MKFSEPDKIKPWCQAREIDLCILFGSQATGKTHRNSDVDIALFSETNPDLSRHLLRFIGEAEDLFGNLIDVVVIDMESDPELLLEIFQHGRLLYESQPGLFIEHRIYAIRIFEDTEPLCRLRDEVLAQRTLNTKTAFS